MPKLLLATLLLLSTTALLSGCDSPDKAPLTAAPPTPPPAEWEPILEEPYGASGRAAVLAEVQRNLVLPLGTPVPPPGSQVVVGFEVGGGMVKKQWIVRSLNQVADSAVLAAVSRLYFKNGPGYNEPSVTYTLVVPAPGAASAAQRREATTRWQRTAVRLPGEADTTFVKRVLPVSYWSTDYGNLQALTCRPSPYGQQLAFTKSVIDPNVAYGSYGWRDTEVFILDPYQPHTYAVQRFYLDNGGDLPDQSVSPFAADVNADGHPDLVALITYSQSEDGGHLNYYRVEVWHTSGLGEDGRPRYRQDETPYPYLEYRQDETPGPYPEEFTPATVLRALARHRRRLSRSAAQPRGKAAAIQHAGKTEDAVPLKGDTAR